LHLNVPYQVRDKLLNSLPKSVFFNNLTEGKRKRKAAVFLLTEVQ